MTGPSNIGWTDYTWNPTTGCDHVSAGCDYCYADDQAVRLQKMGSTKYVNGFKFTVHPDTLNWPLTKKKPGMCFVNSMSDVGHKGMPVEFFAGIVGTMRLANWHIFQVLTKRPVQIRQMLEKTGLSLPSNVWMGVSVEDWRVTWRIEELRKIPAAVRFLSVEPLIGATGIGEDHLRNIDQVIVGGESGPNARKWVGYHDEVRRLRDLCVRLGIAFFYKQGPGRYPGLDRELDGRVWDEFPKEIEHLAKH